MGRWVRGRWICVLGAPDFCPKSLRNKGFGASELKTGGAAKTQIQRPRIQRPILSPLKTLSCAGATPLCTSAN